MSRVVLHYSGKSLVDHISGDTLDNRKSNLRIVSNAQNIRNSGPRNGREFKGVYDLPSGRFAAKLWVAPKLRHLGVFDTLEEAAHCVDEAAVAEFGEYARTNFLNEA